MRLLCPFSEETEAQRAQLFAQGHLAPWCQTQTLVLGMQVSPAFPPQSRAGMPLRCPLHLSASSRLLRPETEDMEAGTISLPLYFLQHPLPGEPLTPLPMLVAIVNVSPDLWEMLRQAHRGLVCG